jgi:hypothetical protein
MNVEKLTMYHCTALFLLSRQKENHPSSANYFYSLIPLEHINEVQ